MIEKIASRLKRLRLAFNYSGAYVADEIDYSANQLWKVERGTSKPNIEMVANLCTLYGISIDLLVFGSGQEFGKVLDEIQSREVDEKAEFLRTLQGYGKAKA